MIDYRFWILDFVTKIFLHCSLFIFQKFLVRDNISFHSLAFMVFLFEISAFHVRP